MDGYITVINTPATFTLPSNSGSGSQTYHVAGGVGGGGQVFVNTTNGQQWTTLTGDLSGHFIVGKLTVSKKEPGCSCKRCNDFNEYAEPNQDDGTFVCYACRKGF